MILDKATPENFQEFYNFFYFGKLKLTKKNFEEIMSLAKIYSVASLATTLIVNNFFQKNCPKAMFLNSWIYL